MNYFPCVPILNQKEEGMKLDEDIIIISESMNGEQIFGRSGDMQNIAESKILSRVMNH
jgi:hypothetical protein